MEVFIWKGNLLDPVKSVQGKGNSRRVTGQYICPVMKEAMSLGHSWVQTTDKNQHFNRAQ